jgi:arylsulfatase A-like enzyme
MNLDDIRLPDHLPDHESVRSDVADYYWEVQRFDTEVGEMLAQLEEMGELDNTIVVITSDNGMPFPRAKANLYDAGTRVPLAILWPQGARGDRVLEDFVSLTDLAPTFLEAAGVPIPEEMTGRSLLGLLQAKKSGRVDPSRSFVLTGKERHVPCQEAPDSGGTPMRSIRTFDYLYIRNFKPERWPSGTPNWDSAYFHGSWYGDTDNGPTKSYMVDNGTDPKVKPFFERAFSKRPARELYDLKRDPAQILNLAESSEHQDLMQSLESQLLEQLKRTGDLRVVGKGDQFEQYPYYGGSPLKPGFKEAPK